MPAAHRVERNRRQLNSLLNRLVIPQAIGLGPAQALATALSEGDATAISEGACRHGGAVVWPHCRCHFPL